MRTSPTRVDVNRNIDRTTRRDLARWLLAIFLAVTVSPVAGDKPPGDANGTIEFHGEIVRVALEGGFWGIVASDGRRFDPGQLPAGFQKAGLRVRVVARLASGRISFRQWGQAIEIVTLEHASAR